MSDRKPDRTPMHRRKQRPKRKGVNVYLTAEEIRTLHELSDEIGCSLSDLIRMALRDYFRERKRQSDRG